MSQTATAFIFVKGTAEHEIERVVAEAQCAATLDTIAKLKTIPEVGEIIIATPSYEFAVHVATLGVRVEADPLDEDFHWGKCLADLVRKYRAALPLYIGGGSGALMSADDWRALVQRVIAEPNTIVTNNFYSCDFAAWSPGDALEQIEPPALDNDLSFRLGERAGLRAIPLPKNAASQLDIDTPTDLLTIALHPACGKHLREFLAATQLDTTNVMRVKNVLGNRERTALIAGRVSAAMALFLERETRCQWRIFSEERGMRASGRIQRGEVRSLLGVLLERLGAREFFAALEQLADAALLDTRVLFAHRRATPSAPDRFYSDLLEPEKIEDAFVRELTAAARDSKIPVLMGGHSLVSGGMYALAEK